MRMCLGLRVVRCVLITEHTGRFCTVYTGRFCTERRLLFRSDNSTALSKAKTNIDCFECYGWNNDTRGDPQRVIYF